MDERWKGAPRNRRGRLRRRGGLGVAQGHLTDQGADLAFKAPEADQDQQRPDIDENDQQIKDQVGAAADAEKVGRRLGQTGAQRQDDAKQKLQDEEQTAGQAVLQRHPAQQRRPGKRRNQDDLDQVHSSLLRIRSMTMFKALLRRCPFCRACRRTAESWSEPR